MTTTSIGTTPAPAAFGAGFEWPGMGALPAVPWELTIQALTLQSTWWAAWATLQARWLGEGAAALGQMPSWAIWHNGTEQLA